MCFCFSVRWKDYCEEKGIIESFQIKKKNHYCPNYIFFLERNDVFIYFWQIVNIIHQFWWLSVQQVGRWIGCWGSFNRHKFRKNRQLLWDIPTPGEDFSGENSDFMCLPFLAKTVIWHGRGNFNMLIDDCTMETHTYYRGKIYQWISEALIQISQWTHLFKKIWSVRYHNQFILRM